MRRAFILAFALLGALAAVANAQAPAGDDSRTDLGSALRAVRPLVRDDPQRAIQLLEKLAVEFPSNPQILILLGETYQQVGDLEKARGAYERCVKEHPTHIQAGAMLGVLHIQNNQTEKGQAVFNELLRSTGYGLGTYRTIGALLGRQGHHDLALRIYREGQRRGGDNVALSLDIAAIERSTGNYEGALREYLRLIETEPREHRLARTKVLELIRDPTVDRDAVIGILTREADASAPHRSEVLSILATAYMEQGALESALDMALKAEEKGVSEGTVLYTLAEQAFGEYRRPSGADKSAYFDLAFRSIRAFLAGHPSSPQAPRAKLMHVDLLSDLASGAVRVNAAAGSPEAVVPDALATLDDIIKSFPRTEYAEQAYLKKGDIVLSLQKKPQEALGIYEAGAKGARFFPAMFAERLGRAYLMLERYDEAERHLGRLVASPSRELKETGVFYAGLLLAFRGKYEAARDTLTQMAETNPSSPYANDAIEVAWFIEEGLQGDQKILARFVDALKHENAGDSARAIADLEQVVNGGAEGPLRARALVRLGGLQAGTGANAVAIATFEKFIKEYPGDILLPDVHRKIGTVYRDGFGDKSAALQKYEEILVLFPHYIFLDEVREDVKRLRAELGSKKDATVQ